MSRLVSFIKDKLLIIMSAFMLMGATSVLSGAVAHAETCRQGYYYWGSSGYCVTNIQVMTNEIWRYYRYANGTIIAEDGQFGPITYNQVRAFQQFSYNDPDGVVGPYTWSALCYYADNIYYNTPLTRGTDALHSAAINSGC
jgi:hypothetical protein